jgi:hypothetical protein
MGSDESESLLALLVLNVISSALKRVGERELVDGVGLPFPSQEQTQSNATIFGRMLILFVYSMEEEKGDGKGDGKGDALLMTLFCCRSIALADPFASW